MTLGNILPLNIHNFYLLRFFFILLCKLQIYQIILRSIFCYIKRIFKDYDFEKGKKRSHFPRKR